MRGLRAWFPLLGFLAAYGALAVLLEAAGTVLFTSLWPFALLALAPWIWWVHLSGRRDVGRVRGTVVTLARLVSLGVLIAVLAEPRAVRVDERMSVVFAIDHSASIHTDTTDTAIEYVLSVVSRKPERDEAGLVFFARDAAVELPPAMTLPFESINVELDRDGTDLAEALSLSAALLPPGRHGRVVLISDGVATEGVLPGVLDDLAAREIAVDVVPIDYRTSDEVWLEKLELPRHVKLGETIEPAVVVSSLLAGEGILTLEEGGREIARQRVSFEAGKNRFTIPLVVDAPGYYEYVARISVPDGRDRWVKNNIAIAALHLKGKGTVLIVVDPNGDPRDHQHLEQALLEREREVSVVGAQALPRDSLALLPFDCIVFVNAPRDTVDEAQMQAVHDAVFHLGSGFLMVGGQDSFGPGGYHRTPIEELLPVSMDMSKKKVLPKGAMGIILHTCEFPQGNTWGKRITLQAMKVLNARDDVGVLVHDFQGGDKWLFKLTPAEEYARLAPLVNNAQIGDMPGFAPTMQMALNGLSKSDASTRHVIIISDGDPVPPPPTLLQAYRQARISVSTVMIFPHRQTGNDVAAMRRIATTTGGRFYQPSDPSKLPAIFIKEAKTLRRSAVQNVVFVPLVEFDSPVLKGIDAMPQLHGYVLTTPKGRSLTILEGPLEGDLDPVLARWRYGVGVTCAFTSDLSSNWGKEWVAWERYSAFVNQLITDISRVDRERRIHASSFLTQGSGIVQAEDHGEDAALLDLNAVIEGPGGVQTIKLEQIAPRRYEARFPLAGVGRYRALVGEVGGEAEDRVPTGFVVPFSEEYRRFRSNPFVLEQIARRTGGRVLDGTEPGEAIFTPEREPRLSSASVVDWLLVLLVLLIPFEVALRRLYVDFESLRRRFARDDAPAATMRALLERKESIASTLGRETSARPPVAPPDPSSPPVHDPMPAGPEPAPADDTADDTLTTTERLLARKRRKQNPEDKE